MLRYQSPVEIDVDQTAMQMLVGLNRCGVIAVFPKCALPPFPLIVFLRGSSSDELHALGNDVWPGVFDE